MISWIIANQSVILVLTNVVLVFVTAVYVILTRSTLMVLKKQVLISSNPIIGITITKMHISKVWGPKRRDLSIELDLQNIGNGPALDIQIDGELLLTNTHANGESIIPARFPPERLSFLLAGQKNNPEKEIVIYFGNKAVIYLFDDIRQADRLNELRLKTDATREPPRASRIRIYVYYSNNLGQLFESTFEVWISMGVDIIMEDPDTNSISIRSKEIPKDNEEFNLEYDPFLRPVFTSRLIDKKDFEKCLVLRYTKRELSGW